MRASRLSVVARGWLEMQGLDHLLPDPHGHEHIKGMIATYYPGGCKRFLQDVDGSLVDLREPAEMSAIADSPRPPLRPRPVVEPTWFKPPKDPIIKTCERVACSAEFETVRVHRRYCSPRCRKTVENDLRRERAADLPSAESWRPFDRATVEQVIGRVA